MYSIYKFIDRNLMLVYSLTICVGTWCSGCSPKYSTDSLKADNKTGNGAEGNIEDPESVKLQGAEETWNNLEFETPSIYKGRYNKGRIGQGQQKIKDLELQNKRSLNEKNIRGKEEITKLKDELEKMRRRAICLEEKVKEKNIKIEELENELAKRVKDNKINTEQIKALQKAKSDIEISLLLSQDQKEKGERVLNAKIDELTKVNSKLRAEIESITNEKNASDKELKELKLEKVEIDKLKQNLAEALLKCEVLAKEVTSLNEKLQSSAEMHNGELEKSRIDCENLNNNLIALNQIISELTKGLESEKKNVGDLEKERSIKIEELQNLKVEVKSLKEELEVNNEKHSDKLKLQEKSNAANDEKIKSLGERIKQKDEEINILTGELNKLKIEFKERMELVENLQNDKTLLQKEVGDKNLQFEDMKKQIDFLNLQLKDFEEFKTKHKLMLLDKQQIFDVNNKMHVVVKELEENLRAEKLKSEKLEKQFYDAIEQIKKKNYQEDNLLRKNMVIGLEKHSSNSSVSTGDMMSPNKECDDPECEMINKDPSIRLDSYLQNVCKNTNKDLAKTKAIKGAKLLGRILNGDIAKEEHATEEDFSNVCWALMFYAFYNNGKEKGKEFESGTFDIEDPYYRLYNFLKNNKDCYTRSSSHYSGEVVGNENWGFDMVNELLPGKEMKTILFARIVKPDSNHIFLKMEDYGCKKLTDKIMHTCGFFRSMFERTFGDRNAFGTQKEHMPRDHENRCRDLVSKIIQAAHESGYYIQSNVNRRTYQFHSVVHLFEEVLQSEVFKRNNDALCLKISDYVDELEECYGAALKTQKGNEVGVTKDLFLKFASDPKIINGL